MTMPASAQELIARVHFAGAARISADTNSAAFTKEFCSAEARTLQAQTLDKLSHFPFNWLKVKIAAGAGDGAAQLRPLLDDFLKAEWLFEMRDTAAGAPEYALAIRLNNERAQLWQDNLQGVLESWTQLKVQKTGTGWEIKKHQPPDRLRFERHGDWVVVDCGENELTLDGKILETFSIEPFLHTGIAVETNWLAADLNWPRLAQIFPALAKFDFPKISLQVAGRENSLWLDGRFVLAQPLPPLENWRLPASVIHTSFSSFTAARGQAPWLGRQEWAQRLDFQPAPAQFFAWALPQIPFQTFAAQPVPDGPAALAQLDAKLAGVFNNDSSNRFFRQIKMDMTNNRIAFTGLPFFSPFMQSVHGPAGDFLFGGFFPNLPRPQPLPPQLLQPLNQPDLVYYHWEDTAERLRELPELSQLLLMVTEHRQFDTQSAAGKWLDVIRPTLGTTLTEVKEVAPDQLVFHRNARGGLTAVELLALANWLEAPDFPGCNLKITPRNPRRPHPQIPGAPGAPPPFQLH